MECTVVNRDYIASVLANAVNLCFGACVLQFSVGPFLGLYQYVHYVN